MLLREHRLITSHLSSLHGSIFSCVTLLPKPANKVLACNARLWESPHPRNWRKARLSTNPSPVSSFTGLYIVRPQRLSLAMPSPSSRPPAASTRQEMLEGKTEFLGKGYWREVRLATYQGQDVAIKTLREDQEETDRNRERHRWEAVALDMVRDLFGAQQHCGIVCVCVATPLCCPSLSTKERFTFGWVKIVLVSFLYLDAYDVLCHVAYAAYHRCAYLPLCRFVPRFGPPAL